MPGPAPRNLGPLADVVPAGVQEARELFAGVGLTLPPIPPSLAPHFAARDKWCFASRPVRTSPYNFHQYVKRAVAQTPKDYVLVAHDGHGANSYALHYYLALRPLMLFLQVGWGGAYTDEARATADANECFAQCGDVMSAVAEAVERGALRRDERVLVVASDLSPGRNVFPPGSLRVGLRPEWREEMSDCPPALVLSKTVQWCQTLVAGGSGREEPT